MVALLAALGLAVASPSRGEAAEPMWYQHWLSCDRLTEADVARQETWFRQAELKVLRENAAQLGVPVVSESLSLSASADLRPLRDAISLARSQGDGVLLSTPGDYFEIAGDDPSAGRWLVVQVFAGAARKMTLAEIARSEGVINGVFLLKREQVQSLALAKIACFESSFEIHAKDGKYLGLFQIDAPKIDGYGVGLERYWNGSDGHRPAFYQLLTGMLYIKDRYGSAVEAWRHERDYGWY